MSQSIFPVHWIHLTLRGDERGDLVVVESERDVDFAIRRVYFLPRTALGVARGFHAHKHLRQVLIAASGSCRILLHNGKCAYDVILDSPTKGLEVNPMMWHEMHDFTEDCVLLVLASDLYDESDYIRDFNEFLSLANPR